MLNFFIIIALLLGIFLFGSWFERRNVYFPDRNITVFPDALGLSYKDVYFKASDGTELHGWYVPSGVPARASFLFCHGNAGNIGDRIELISILHGLNVNILIFDYRGYGNSKGVPSENGTYADAEAAYEKLREIDPANKDRIILYGRSMGGAVAVELARRVDAKGLVTDSVFTSTGDMSKEVYPILPFKISLMVRYDSISKISRLKTPKLMIHSTEDEIVPFAQGKELFEKASEPKDFYRMRGGHNDAVFMQSEEYLRRINMFLESLGIGSEARS
ncbi:MAG: alpha/beta hydrolase [Candidatus Omnitrophota bacterium]